MFRVWCLALMLLVFVPGCSSPKIPPPGPRPSSTERTPGAGGLVGVRELGESDRVLHGIRLGMSVEEAKDLLVSPVFSRSPENNSESWRQGDSEGVSFSFENGLVWHVRDAKGPTPRGLRIGDSSLRVEQLYGKPIDVNKYGWWHYEGDGGLSLFVVVHESTVRSVIIEDRGVLKAHNLEPQQSTSNQPDGMSETRRERLVALGWSVWRHILDGDREGIKRLLTSDTREIEVLVDGFGEGLGTQYESGLDALIKWGRVQAQTATVSAVYVGDRKRGDTLDVVTLSGTTDRMWIFTSMTDGRIVKIIVGGEDGV